MEIIRNPSIEEMEDNIIKINFGVIDESNNSLIKNTKTSNLNQRERRVKKPRVIEDLGCFNNSLLSKKTQRTCTDHNKAQRNKKEFSTKMKKCLRIFNQFKSSILYHDYPLLVKIEKNLKANYYTHHSKLAQDIRDIFTQYFIQYSFEPENYVKALSSCSTFEAIYKDYDNKIFVKESKNLIEIKKKLNKLQRELKESSGNGNGSGNNNNKSSNSHHGSQHYHRHDSNDTAMVDYTYNDNKIANRKYKLSLANNIRHLSLEQKKGIAALLSKGSLDQNAQTFEIDVNKIPSYQLKELNKYVQKCLNSNMSISSENENVLQKLDSTINTQSQDIHDDNNNYLVENKQSIFSSDSELSSDESDSDEDDDGESNY